MKTNNDLFFTDKEAKRSYSILNQFNEHLEFNLVKDRRTVTKNDYYYALSLSVRDKMIRNWLRTQEVYKEKDVKRVYYLSMEFLMGRLLENALINLDLYDEVKKITNDEGIVLEDIIELENDMGLGNGGLGRLASCFLDSMATLELPAFGYGIRYEYGIFKQEIEKGFQVEQPDNWLTYGNPWEVFRRDLVFRIKFYGNIDSYTDSDNRLRYNWTNTDDVFAVAYDIPIPGYKNNTVNNLRLWQAKSTNEFSFSDFNSGNYLAAVINKNLSENISKVLYPNDTSQQGKFLRLQQEYFFVAASLQDIIRKYKINDKNIKNFGIKTAIQLNDTHPVIAIPELMRILLDDEGLVWEEAWEITSKTFAYTNHTVVPEALEEWSVSIMGKLLPRHLQIIYEINARFLDFVRKNISREDTFIRDISIIREHPEKTVRMAFLSIVASVSVNGVAALHSEILKNRLFPLFNRIFPHKFINVTNGITPRRWLKTANPRLANFFDDKIGSGWTIDLEQLRKIEQFIDNDEFLDMWDNIKWFNKNLLKQYIENEHNIKINLDSIFDVQVKRFHEYKRQLLNVLHIITLYNRIKRNPNGQVVPRTFIFSGKAAPAYSTAKLIIKLINNVADVINNDIEIGDKIKVVFLKNYNVSLAEKIIPAADLSEQISTAGFEASGTGNMKFALNGALTIGTMDGANIEIREEVGEDNIFIFGLLEDEVIKLKQNGYDPGSYYKKNSELKQVIDMIANNFFSPYEPGIFNYIVEILMNIDYYCLFADYDSYVKTQEKVSELYLNKKEWNKKSVVNASRIGKFSSDRSILDYNNLIWKLKSIKINIKE